MPKKRVPEGEKKVTFSISIKKKLVDELRKIKGYSRIVEKLIEEYLSSRK
jgi:metal-responsive CopG/Arc/MetJ family transcriptional regulator